MARPTKRQLEERKQAKRAERRGAELEAWHRQAPYAGLADFAYVECEACDQEQVQGTNAWGYVDDAGNLWKPGDEQDAGCVVCGHEIARTHPLHDEFLAELRALRDSVLE